MSVHDFSESVTDFLTRANVTENVDDIDKRYIENVDGNDKEIMPSDNVSNVKSNVSSESRSSRMEQMEMEISI